MSTSPSRRDLLAGLFVAGLTWLGLGRRAAAAPAPAVPQQPDTETPSRLSYSYDSSSRSVVCTATYDCYGELIWEQGGVHWMSYSYDTYGNPSQDNPSPGIEPLPPRNGEGEEEKP